MSIAGLYGRITTAIIFVIVMLGGLYGGRHSFTLLFCLITAGCIWEYLHLTLDKGRWRDRLRILIGLVFGISPFVITTILQLGWVQSSGGFIALISILFFPLIFLAFIYELFSGSPQPFANVAYIVLGMIYIGVPFAILPLIAFEGDHFYANIVMGLLLMTWSNDTGAYLLGSRFGKHKLLPRISPNKTVEGFLGGVIVTLILAIGLGFWFKELSRLDWMVLATIVVLFGSLGDLVESMLKRSRDVKDSGKILPGHGGLLDRFDGFIFVLPFAAAYLLLIR
ncbi:MAG: phosphatidate cytidylyltransferase [Saprospiraceae bacterium]|nr:phosphatidate cytidylyltransferase [Saprospiraceae bacterium]